MHSTEIGSVQFCYMEMSQSPRYLTLGCVKLTRIVPVQSIHVPRKHALWHGLYRVQCSASISVAQLRELTAYVEALIVRLVVLVLPVVLLSSLSHVHEQTS